MLDVEVEAGAEKSASPENARRRKSLVQSATVWRFRRTHSVVWMHMGHDLLGVLDSLEVYDQLPPNGLADP